MAHEAKFRGDGPPRVADPSEPHWVVKAMGRRGPGEFTPRLHFMHPSLDLAEAEAKRLAAAHPGKRFSVYASVSSFKEPAGKEKTE